MVLRVYLIPESRMSDDSEKASGKLFIVKVKGRLHLQMIATCFDGKRHQARLVISTQHIRPCGLMDKAPDFGSGDCRFESCHGRFLFGTGYGIYVDVERPRCT